jgi:predicted nucleic-acid-binding protein
VIAVDTNVIVRFLTNDDIGQSQRAAALFQSNDIWISKTVLLETEWVLRKLYHFATGQVFAAFASLIGLSNVQVEDELAVARALEWAEAGLDFADGLHLASRGESHEFVSFDEKFVNRARRAALKGVTLLRI